MRMMQKRTLALLLALCLLLSAAFAEAPTAQPQPATPRSGDGAARHAGAGGDEELGNNGSGRDEEHAAGDHRHAGGGRRIDLRAHERRCVHRAGRWSEHDGPDHGRNGLAGAGRKRGPDDGRTLALRGRDGLADPERGCGPGDGRALALLQRNAYAGRGGDAHPDLERRGNDPCAGRRRPGLVLGRRAKALRRTGRVADPDRGDHLHRLGRTVHPHRRGGAAGAGGGICPRRRGLPRGGELHPLHLGRRPERRDAGRYHLPLGGQGRGRAAHALHGAGTHRPGGDRGGAAGGAGNVPRGRVVVHDPLVHAQRRAGHAHRLYLRSLGG